MTRPPDMLRFLDPRLESGRLEFGWTGPWPPPERLALAIGRESGIVRVIERDDVDADLLRELEDAPTIDVVDFTLRNASSLPDEFESEHVFRGAEYVAEAVAA